MMGPMIMAALAALLALGGVDTRPMGHPVVGERALGRVSAIDLAPVDGGIAIVLRLDADLPVRHFVLAEPSRIVVDIGGASLAVRTAYDGQRRGPVRNIRLGQYMPDTVRLVIDLTAQETYRVERVNGHIRVLLEVPDTPVSRWGTTPLAVVGEPQAIPASDAPGADRMVPSAQAPVPAQPTPGPLAAQTAPVAAAAGEPLERSNPAPVASPPADATSQAPMTPRTAGPIGTMGVGAGRRQPPPKPRIRVQFDNEDIRDVIAAFAAFSGRSIMVGKDVAGAVTADINDKPWDVALQAILQSQGLAATEDASGIITVDSYKNLAANQALEPLVTQVVSVNYARASALVPTLTALLARDCTGAGAQQVGAAASGGQAGAAGCVVRGRIASDSATNKLIISEVPSRLPELLARIQQLDLRTQQVAIKAKIVFVNRTGIQEMGLAYDLGQGNKQFFQQLVPRIDPNTLVPTDTDGDGVPDAMGGGQAYQAPARIALGGNAIAGIANANNAIKPNALNLIYSTALGRFQLSAFLNALQQTSLAEIQSEPSVTTVNNRSAEIFVGQEIPIRVIDANAGGAGGGAGAGGGGGGAGGGAGGQPNAAIFFPRAAVTKEEAGIKLSVTPQITNNQMVMLNINAENSSAELASSEIGVVFNRQRAQTQVLVANGEAAVIGGLTVTETTRFRTGIPVLMNLPFIGRLFSTTSKNEAKRDLLILVTPHILEDDATPPGR
jgi:type IV pilus assembly protein PilQ